MEDFLKAYQEDKKVRDLIKRRTFKSKSIYGHDFDNHDLKFKITHVKQSNKYYCDVLVNIKVCGRIKTWYFGLDENGMCDITKKKSFISVKNRNSNIRKYVKKEIEKYLLLFGVKSYYIEIGKVTVAKSL